MPLDACELGLDVDYVQFTCCLDLGLVQGDEGLICVSPPLTFDQKSRRF
jgi:hypothetical protein